MTWKFLTHEGWITWSVIQLFFTALQRQRNNTVNIYSLPPPCCSPLTLLPLPSFPPSSSPSLLPPFPLPPLLHNYDNCNIVNMYTPRTLIMFLGSRSLSGMSSIILDSKEEKKFTPIKNVLLVIITSPVYRWDEKQVFSVHAKLLLLHCTWMMQSHSTHNVRWNSHCCLLHCLHIS